MDSQNLVSSRLPCAYSPFASLLLHFDPNDATPNLRPDGRATVYIIFWSNADLLSRSFYSLSSPDSLARLCRTTRIESAISRRDKVPEGDKNENGGTGLRVPKGRDMYVVLFLWLTNLSCE